MDVGGHQFTDSRIHRPMARNRIEAGKRVADHFHPKVSASILRTGVTDVAMALVLNRKRGGRKRCLQRGAYRRDTLISGERT